MTPAQRRRFHRILLTSKSSLIRGDNRHEGRLENASLNGALISFSERIPVREGERCTLVIYPDEGGAPLELTVDIIHTHFTMVGVQFVEVEEEARQRLYRIIEEASDEPALLRSEYEYLKGQVAGYFRQT